MKLLFCQNFNESKFRKVVNLETKSIICSISLIFYVENKPSSNKWCSLHLCMFQGMFQWSLAWTCDGDLSPSKFKTWWGFASFHLSKNHSLDKWWSFASCNVSMESSLNKCWSFTSLHVPMKPNETNGGS